MCPKPKVLCVLPWVGVKEVESVVRGVVESGLDGKETVELHSNEEVRFQVLEMASAIKN